MSRSRKQAIIKYKGDKTYNKRFRRVNKQRVHEGKELIEMNSLIEPNEVCRYTIDLEHKNKKCRRSIKKEFDSG